MTWFNKRLLKLLGRLVVFVAPQFLGRPYTEKHSSTTVTETRRTEKTEGKKKQP
jgi:hypothetical protein